MYSMCSITQRGVSIKATPLSLVMSDSKEKSYLLNIFDTPGMTTFVPYLVY